MGCGASAEKGGTFSLPQRDADAAGREAQLAAQRKAYPWSVAPGAFAACPPVSLEVPKEEKNSDAVAHTGTMLTDAALIVGKMKLKSNIESLEDFMSSVGDAIFGGGGVEAAPDASTDLAAAARVAFDDFYAAFDGEAASFPTPLIAQAKYDWTSDRVFGFQRANGINPTVLARVDSVAALPVPRAELTDALLAGVLPAPLEELIDAKRVFACDYVQHTKAGVLPKEHCGLAPVVLLYLDNEKHLMPFAIKLHEWPSATAAPIQEAIFTPNDPPVVWLAAKIHANSVDISYNTVHSHLVNTHFLMESAYMAMRKTLSPRHPVLELVRENLWYTIQINVLGRALLVKPLAETRSFGHEGFGVLVESAANAIDWATLDVPRAIAARGLDDVAATPDFLWRDDALAMWRAEEAFVRAVLAHYYATDADVAADTELQAWVALLRQPRNDADAEKGGCGLKNVGDVKTVDAVVNTVTRVLYCVSAGHAAVNNGQYEYFGFVPSAPGRFLLPMDALKNKPASLTLEHIRKAMPPAKRAEMQTATAMLLTTPTEDPLGSYSDDWFRGEAHARTALGNFQKALDGLSTKIRARNASVFMPYLFLDPKQVAQGIAI